MQAKVVVIKDRPRVAAAEHHEGCGRGEQIAGSVRSRHLVARHRNVVDVICEFIVVDDDDECKYEDA